MFKIKYHCEVCDSFMRPESKDKHFNSNIHKEFDKCKHINITIENAINDIDEIFYAKFIEHKKYMTIILWNASLI